MGIQTGTTERRREGGRGRKREGETQTGLIAAPVRNDRQQVADRASGLYASLAQRRELPANTPSLRSSFPASKHGPRACGGSAPKPAGLPAATLPRRAGQSAATLPRNRRANLRLERDGAERRREESATMRGPRDPLMSLDRGGRSQSFRSTPTSRPDLSVEKIVMD